MTIAQVMRTDVAALRPEDPIATGWRSIRRQRLGGVPVADAAGRVVGLLTEADLIERWLPPCRRHWWDLWLPDCEQLADHYRKTHGVTVSDVMSLETASVAPGDSPETAAARMRERDLPILPVVADNRLVGVVTGSDLVGDQVLPTSATYPVSDAELVQTMQRQMYAEPWTSRYFVEVRATAGVLELRGIVESQAERRALRAMARSVAGAVVDDHLLVRTERPAACI